MMFFFAASKQRKKGTFLFSMSGPVFFFYLLRGCEIVVSYNSRLCGGFLMVVFGGLVGVKLTCDKIKVLFDESLLIKCPWNCLLY